MILLQIIPFLALGLGVDDMFLIAHTYAENANNRNIAISVSMHLISLLFMTKCALCTFLVKLLLLILLLSRHALMRTMKWQIYHGNRWVIIDMPWYGPAMYNVQTGEAFRGGGGIFIPGQHCTNNNGPLPLDAMLLCGVIYSSVCSCLYWGSTDPPWYVEGIYLSGD